MLQLLHKDYSFTYPPQSIARYSFIQLSELRQDGVNEIAQASKRQQEDSNPSLDNVLDARQHIGDIRGGVGVGVGGGGGGTQYIASIPSLIIYPPYPL